MSDGIGQRVENFFVSNIDKINSERDLLVFLKLVSHFSGQVLYLNCDGNSKKLDQLLTVLEYDLLSGSSYAHKLKVEKENLK